ncbi:4-hydroxy-tetrahydrodipicolinate synthase [Fodinibius roseus]|uniref:4-hydroxy-tetrahydrodipicolinate synthase n=1 Tax=Fodinibius roseus TaxID=1194090 RepID=A0A1M4YM07_9BACT|nr:dihydrodipicolinate synthase family protein [Fodinibius roseus]SHF06781.1 4-hydroxy-tetrahydrodipicolinate synthase [Fodinibius roseus]
MSLNNIGSLPKGLWPVMITPFNEDQTIDYKALEILTDFYLDSGSSGLFVNCLSSEMYYLTPEERLQLTERVVNHVEERVPVISTGTFGGSIREQVEFIKKMSDKGVEAVVLVTSLLAKKEEEDEILLTRLDQISEATGEIRLGIYECPTPYKRLISPSVMQWLVDSGRFYYHKDTSCNINDIKEKIELTRNSNLNFYNANTPTAYESLQLGGDGLSPISANFYPELYSYLCEHFRNGSRESSINYLQRMLTLLDGITRNKYPLMAKAFLRKRGIPIKLELRISQENLTYEEERIMDSLFVAVEEIRKELGIDEPLYVAK